MSSPINSPVAFAIPRFAAIRGLPSGLLCQYVSSFSYRLMTSTVLSLDPPSIILLDWSCRERFHALQWLADQTVARDQYELIWVELFDRVVPQALQGADVVLTCSQKGTYHKHEGYNAGLLVSRGKVVTVCDS